MLTAAVVGLVVAGAAPRLVRAQGVPGPPSAPARTLTVQGIVTALGGEVRLPGASVRLDPVANAASGSTSQHSMSDDQGRFQFVGLLAASYRLTVSLSGFVDATRDILVEPGHGTDVVVDLQIAGVSETITVVPQVTLDVGAALGSAGIIDFTQLQTSPAGDVSIEGALPLVPGVIHGPSGVSIKGGRPTQSSVQLGNADLTDASTGEAEFRLPSNAVGSLEVLPSPYAVEYGRFSAGLTVVQSRRGGDAWRFSLAAINPSFRTKRGHPFTVLGIETFSPRLWLGGPVVKDRVFIAQSLQYRSSHTEVRSRPQDERTHTESMASFTRLDARLTPRHILTATAGFFPEARQHANLGTFDPPSVTASIRRRVVDMTAALESAVGAASFVETMVHVKGHHVHVTGEGHDEMVFTPQGREGHFFNDQDRNTWSLQWRQAVSGIRQHAVGTHFYQAGLDLVHSSFDGTSLSRPVLIRNAAGALVRHITFGEEAPVAASATDVALFVQDRWQPTERVLVDAGVRWDRDGVLDEGTWSPRLGVRLSLDARDGMTLGAGVGRFTERTPLTLATLEWVGTRTITNDEEAGSPAPSSVTYRPRYGAPGLEAPRALTWHVEYRWRLSPALTVRANVLARDSRREYLVTPELAEGAGWLTVDSSGRSQYREAALGVRYARGAAFSSDVSYVRSTARADLNSYAAFFGTLRAPIVRANAYAATESDVPHRLIAQVRGEAGRWRAASVFECRNGLPYSALNARQDYVGVVNSAGRLRTFVSLDTTMERRFRFGKVRPWIGLQLLNALGRFNPRDVQQNLDAADYGAFYNSEPRRLRLTLRF